MVFDLRGFFNFQNVIFRKKNSGNVAKERLRILLISDRSGCSPETLEMIKAEIFNVISKYIEIDKDESVIEIEKSNQPHIFANIPIKEVKHK